MCNFISYFPLKFFSSSYNLFAFFGCLFICVSSVYLSSRYFSASGSLFPFSKHQEKLNSQSLSLLREAEEVDYFAEAALLYEKNLYQDCFDFLLKCIPWDSRCQNLIGEYYFLGLPPIYRRDLAAALAVWWKSADLGNADAQFSLALVFDNFYNLPSLTNYNYFKHFASDKNNSYCYSRASYSSKVSREKKQKKRIPLKVDSAGVLHIYEGELKHIYSKFKVAFDNLHPNSSSFFSKIYNFFASSSSVEELFKENDQTRHNYTHNPISHFNDTYLYKQEDFAHLLMYASSLAGHVGALLAMGNRHDVGMNTPKRCSSAALYYLEVAKSVVEVYSSGMPQALELIRFRVQRSHTSFSSSASSSIDKTSRNPHQTDFLLHLASQAKNNKMQTSVGKRYLLGIDGFPQNYNLAYKYLKMASSDNFGEAMGYLAYMYALGLGMDKPDIDEAAYWFSKGSNEFRDPYSMNGMGYVYFFGTSKYPMNHRKALLYFNQSAHEDVADAQFNLGAMYMTGTGTNQSFLRAIEWLSKATEQGHTPAAYSLAIMHLNGLGTIRDCLIASALLKRVAERGEWLTKNLQKAYYLEQNGYNDHSAYIFWKLAEAGHEVSQSNLAVLLESGKSNLFMTNNKYEQRIYSHRFIEMNAKLGSAEAYLKLGDYSYNGWGVETIYVPNPAKKVLVDDEGNDMSDMVVDLVPRYIPASRNFPQTMAYYRKAAEGNKNVKFTNKHVARAYHNLGYMYMRGIGIPRDFYFARTYYERVLEIEGGLSNIPILLSLWILTLHEIYFLSQWKTILQALMDDHRVFYICHNIILIILIYIFRYIAKMEKEKADLRKEKQNKEQEEKKEQEKKKEEQEKKKEQEEEKKEQEEEKEEQEEIKGTAEQNSLNENEYDEEKGKAEEENLNESNNKEKSKKVRKEESKENEEVGDYEEGEVKEGEFLIFPLNDKCKNKREKDLKVKESDYSDAEDVVPVCRAYSTCNLNSLSLREKKEEKYAGNSENEEDESRKNI